MGSGVSSLEAAEDAPEEALEASSEVEPEDELLAGVVPQADRDSSRTKDINNVKIRRMVKNIPSLYAGFLKYKPDSIQFDMILHYISRFDIKKPQSDNKKSKKRTIFTEETGLLQFPLDK